MIGVDIGRNQVKVYSKDLKAKFPSRVGEWRERRLNSGGNYELEYNGQKYFIGELAEESYCVREMATESKVHEESKLLFITAVALANLPEVNVVTGLPVAQHTEQGKIQFADLLTGRYTIKLNGLTKTFTVKNIGIVAESAGSYWNEVLGNTGRQEKELYETVRIIDIGSRTINYCTIKNKKFIDKLSDTLQYGIIELDNAGDVKEQFARRIVADISKKWLDQSGDIILTGGGALLLYNYLKPHYPTARLADDPVFSNVKGFYKMGCARWLNH